MTLTTQDLKMQYRIQRSIDARLDDVITLVYETDLDGVKKAQLQNLLNLALQTSSISVITSWIEYQMGRRKPPIPPNVGESILANIANGTIELTEMIRKELQLSDRRELYLIRLRLLRLYLGHLVRGFVSRYGE